MILEQLRLRNYCLYRGEQTLNLAPTIRRGKPAPIVLFGGINGGGKTTLLDAVQLALYGIRSRCSKRAEKSYEEFLRDSIHHGADADEGAEISLSFRYVSEGEQHLYEVTRSWYPVGSRIRESVHVTRDGVTDTWLSDNWNQLVDELIPVGIAQLCFFDAEKIRFLADDETSTQALGDAIKSLLGLDLAERLIADASVLETRIVKRRTKSAELTQIDELEKELAAKQTAIDALVQDLGALENPRLAAKNRLSQAEERFAQTGGKHWEQREQRQQERTELEERLSQIRQQLVGLAATELPLALVGDLLQRVDEQDRRERSAAETAILSEFLEERDARLLDFLCQRKVGTKAQKTVREFCESDREQRTHAEPVEQRLQLSENARRSLSHLQATGLKERRNTARALLELFENTERALVETQRSLAAVPRDESLKDVAHELKVAAAELTGLEQQVNSLDKQLQSLRWERGELEKQLSRLKRKVIDEQLKLEEDSRLAELTARTQQTMRAFLEQATARKIDRLSQHITESFRFLLRKKTLVERVVIDPGSFSITLHGVDGGVVAKQRLSEGEKQIFAISVLWGLSRASARSLPAIIDTPMARLDAEHRSQLVNRYFPNASHQVIVLSTDTEIDRQYFQDLQASIARAYHLNYDEAERATVAEEGYFWGHRSAKPSAEVMA